MIRGFDPFGHRSGAVRVHETAVAAAGPAAAGLDEAAVTLMTGVLDADAAASFGLRLPEIYAAEQRGRRRRALPASAGPPSRRASGGRAGPSAGRPGRGADRRAGRGRRAAAAVPCTGGGGPAERDAGRRAPFAVRVGRLGTAIAEGAAPGPRLGA
ncbi:hypothetical protein SCOCK_190078 [Actinacidiphila cocklensis]|uniref:Uncharacterized protein n=1 Tax=Actinacidiphila cocklensis TaxID=887465 RepID=A0A9W4GPV9_9ACTN|nr:hypothetical protein SCOCK_190078 [Actinacidiphila cocklensis]